MKRRKALRNTTLLIGSALALPTLSGLWQSCQTSGEAKEGLLNTDEFDLISQLSETIIPKTYTPGAIEAGVPEFIDLILTDVSTQEEVDNFKSILQVFDDNCEAMTGQSFSAGSGENRESFLSAIEEGQSTIEEISITFYQTVKHFTLLAYFSSEAGMTQALNYQPLPGGYDPCARIDPGERIMVSARI